MHMRKMLAAMLLLVLLALATAAAAATFRPTQILFVGNSLTYVGNLPAVFTALAADNGKTVHTDMLVKGGATLTQWQRSGALPRALKASRYGYVVLQERGGAFACGFGPQDCHQSQDTLRKLAKVARAGHAQPILLGTYQVNPKASQELLAAESQAARANTMPYIAVSKRLNEARKQYPYLDWFAKEGHPGHDLVLLEAVLLYKQLYGALPESKTLDVRAPMFVPGSKFAPPDPVSLPLLPNVALAGGYDYAPMEMAAALNLAH